MRTSAQSQSSVAALHAQLPQGRRGLPRQSSWKRRLSVLLAVLNLGACYAWQPAYDPLPQVVQEHQQSRIRVALRDGTLIEVTNPAIVGDSLYARRRGEMPVARAVVRDVESVDVREIKAGQTATTLVIVPILGFGALLMIACC